MLMPMLWLSLTPLVVPTTPVPFTQAAVGVPSLAAVVQFAPDSGDTTQAGRLPLTAELLTHYLALKQDLQGFWRTHQPLLAAAQKTTQIHVVQAHVGGIFGDDSIVVFNYVVLTAQHPALSALFTKHSLRPQQFEPIEDAVSAALLAVTASIHSGTPLDDPANFGDDPTHVLQRNALLVLPYIQALKAVGIQEE